MGREEHEALATKRLSGELGEAFLQYLARPCAPEAKAERRQKLAEAIVNKLEAEAPKESIEMLTDLLEAIDEKFASIVRAEMPKDMSS